MSGTGTIRDIVNNAGTSVERRKYDAFGKATSTWAADFVFGFDGMPYDAASGTYGTDSRVYDPSTGRFLSEDPTSPPPDQNRYRWCGNNPLTRTDPSGMCWSGLGSSAGLGFSVAQPFSSLFGGSSLPGGFNTYSPTVSSFNISRSVASGSSFGSSGYSSASPSYSFGQSGLEVSGYAPSVDYVDLGSSNELFTIYPGEGLAAGSYSKLGLFTAPKVDPNQVLAATGPQLVRTETRTTYWSDYRTRVADGEVGWVERMLCAVPNTLFAPPSPLTTIDHYSDGSTVTHLGGPSASGDMAGQAALVAGPLMSLANGVRATVKDVIWSVVDQSVNEVNPTPIPISVRPRPSAHVEEPVVFKEVPNPATRGKPSTLQPGAYARESIPLKGVGRKPTAAQQRAINEIGNKHGCHTCGSPTPGTDSGNWVLDHQPPTKMTLPGQSQVGYPHCVGCFRHQGGDVRAWQQ